MTNKTIPLSRVIELPGETFLRVFPFFFAWDETQRIVNFGPSLGKICEDVQRGIWIGELFEMIRPEVGFEAEVLKKHLKELFFFRHRKSKTSFRGQIVELPKSGVMVMLCSPWLQSTAEMEALGITFEDFAIHDSSLDLLQLLQTQQMANEDLQKLTNRLTEQRSLLRQREAEYKKLALVAARTDNAVVVTDAQGCIEWVNDGFVRISGWTLEEVMGKTPGSVLQGPDTDAVMVAYMRQQLLAGKGFKGEILNYHKNGSRYWLSLEVQPIFDEDGKVTNFMAIESDITQELRDKKRRDLQFTVSRLLTEVNSIEEASARIIQDVCCRLGWAKGGMWMLDEAREHLSLVEAWYDESQDLAHFVQTSRQYAFMKGVGLPGRVWETGKSVWIPDVAVDSGFLRASVAKEAGLHGGLAFPIVNQGRVLGVLEFFSSRIEEPDENLLETVNGIGNQFGQFLERKKAEEALQEAHTLQRAILAGATYSIIAADLDGTIRTFNHAAERMLGYQAEEMVGKQTPAIIHLKEEIEKRAEQLTQELGYPVEPGFETFVAKAKLGTPDEGEWTYVRKDGSTFPALLCVTALFNSHGVVTGYMGVASDITERKRAAEALVAAKELAEAANQAKSDFLATMSHEIRTPMNGIIGMSSLLLESRLEPSQREMTEAVRNSGEALMTIIDDILDFSKIEARRLDLVNEAFSIDAVLDGVVDLLYHKVHQKGLEMSVLIDPDVPASLNGDPGRLRQVILNLVGNAIKFTDEGEVNVFVRRVHEKEVAQEFIEFVVDDTGIGMTPEQMSRLFTPFTQVDGSSTRRFGGTGLGLVISKRLVEMMGGCIVVESTLQYGSQFSFRIPVSIASGAEPPMQWSDREKDLRVLVADDVLLSRRAAELALKGLSQPALIVDNEAAAVAALLDPQSVWDLLVIDRRLFGDRSMDTLKILEKEKRRPKVIILGQLTDSARERSALGGVDVYLLKPVRRMQLRQGLREALEVKDSPTEMVSKPAVTHEKAMPHFLIVEDNEVNARLAILHLDKLGFTRDVARDGAEAVELFEKGIYDGILMDCHMPVMDGYEATRRIREIEASPEWHRPRVRIIAMTANAMSGERERCMEAGMDDYLAKPLRAAILLQALSHVQRLDDIPPEKETEMPLDAQDVHEVISSIDQLAEELSAEAAAQLIENWLKDTPDRLGEISELAGGGDQTKLKRAAHSLKGSSALFGLNGIRNLCRDIELLAERDLTPGQPLLASALHQAFDAAVPLLRSELTRLQQTPSS
ncbi:PAS domain S-box-containing protein [Prosthecobacter debontii]|uniref:Sensory/regulatory protein RpfC n=1 Tax=Prosthecobacter debontii TaxID=48467 RepID=A0A1T4XVJ4_9BACT|nr:PAS domain S-box protein [Prosthecobacter debontii]SKA93198.1 PAS domain S-box-containing protein [Prosthecobacter debontii]